MIVKEGKVTVTATQVLVTDFAFEGVQLYPPAQPDIQQRAAQEAIKWAMGRLQAELVTIDEQLKSGRKAA